MPPHRGEGVDGGCMCNRHPRNGSALVLAVAWSPDGKSLASGSADKTVRVFNAADGTCQKVLDDHSRPVGQVEFLDGSTLVSASDDGSIKVWDVASGTPKDTVAGEKFALSKKTGAKEQRAGRFLVTWKGGAFP